MRAPSAAIEPFRAAAVAVTEVAAQVLTVGAAAKPLPCNGIVFVADVPFRDKVRVTLPSRLPADFGTNSIPRTQLAPAASVWPAALHVVSELRTLKSGDEEIARSI